MGTVLYILNCTGNPPHTLSPGFSALRTPGNVRSIDGFLRHNQLPAGFALFPRHPRDNAYTNHHALSRGHPSGQQRPLALANPPNRARHCFTPGTTGKGSTALYPYHRSPYEQWLAEDGSFLRPLKWSVQHAAVLFCLPWHKASENVTKRKCTPCSFRQNLEASGGASPTH